MWSALPDPFKICAPILRIDDPADPRLDDYRAIRERQLAARATFIAESEVVLRVLLARGRYPIRSLLLAEGRFEKLADALADLDRAVPIYLASQAVLDGVTGFHIHRGILAACERLPVPSPEALLAAMDSGPRRVVLLESLTNHDNVGGVFRNAAAFGADAVLLDHATCDPLYRKAIRVSAGAVLFVPYARAADTAGSLAALRDHGFSTLGLTPQGRLEIGALDVPERCALILGTEGAGLSAATLAACDHTLRIAMAPGFDSLNVATTSGIALHALRQPIGQSER
jgi:tRNA G18 (ribose-2'-O)-methylase SpoU